MAVSKECLHVFYLRPQPHTLRTASQATNVSVAACEFATYTLTQTNSGHAVMKNYLKTLEAKRRRRRGGGGAQINTVLYIQRSQLAPYSKLLG